MPFAWRQTLSIKDSNYVRDARAAMGAQGHPLAGFGLLLMVTVVVVFYLWADSAIVDEVTRGEGTVVPSSREQVIQSLEGGILSELMVREGDIVEPGQVLLRIDDTRAGASLREGQSKADSLLAEIARLRAEARGQTLKFDQSLASELQARERQLYEARQRTLRQSIGALQRNLALADEELSMTEPMVARGAVSEVEVLRLKREISELRGRIQDRRNSFRSEAGEDLAAKEAELGAITELLTARADHVRRTVVRAPLRGSVKNVRVNTVGGVIAPGADIMELVPLEDRLLIEARIRPADVAFLRPGQPATVKLSAYDYSIYGGLDGELEQISADTISDENNPDERYYRIYVRTKDSVLRHNGEQLPVIPGMVATVEVLTGSKSVLEYLLKPVLKVRENALHER